MRYCIKNMKMTDALVFSEQLKELESTESVEFNFSGRWKVRPLGMLVIGAMIRKYRSKYADNHFKISGYEDKSYLGTMGFFKYISPQLEIGKFPGESKGSDNYIPITAIKFNELKEDNYKKGNYAVMGDLIEKESGRLAKVISRNNTELHKLLTFLIREILRNTHEHAKTDTSWICGQYWPSYNEAEIGIIDEGIGVFESLALTKHIKNTLLIIKVLYSGL